MHIPVPSVSLDPLAVAQFNIRPHRLITIPNFLHGDHKQLRISFTQQRGPYPCLMQGLAVHFQRDHKATTTTCSDFRHIQSLSDTFPRLHRHHVFAHAVRRYHCVFDTVSLPPKAIPTLSITSNRPSAQNSNVQSINFHVQFKHIHCVDLRTL